jgi:hypothetical protein
VLVASKRALGALLHPPAMIAADDEDFQASARPPSTSAFIADRSFPESSVVGHDTIGRTSQNTG